MIVETNIRTAHHASTGIHCIMNRICRDKSIGTLEHNPNHYELIDVLEIIADDFFGKVGIVSTNDKVSSSSDVFHFICDMI